MNYKYLSVLAKNKVKIDNVSFLLENISDSIYGNQYLLFHSKLTEIEDYLVGIYLILTGQYVSINVFSTFSILS